MKKMNLFMLAFAALAFAACSNEDDVLSGTGNTGGPTPQGDAWVALKIKKPAGTKALNTPDQETGLPNESDIKGVRIIFFDATKNVTDDISFATLAAPNTAFKVSSEAKHLLVVVNPPASYPASWGKDTPFTTVNAALTADVSTLISATHGFMMTNAKGDLEPSDPTNGDLKELKTHNSAPEAEKTENVINLNVDRVVSKVRVLTDADLVAHSTLGTVDLATLGWVLNVTNKKYFPVSERTATYNETTSGDFLAPFDKYELGSYRKDPNYDHALIIYDPNDATEMAIYNANYNYYTEANAPATSDWKVPTTSSTTAPFFYCLENTQQQKDNVHAYTTQVLLKLGYAPKGLSQPGTDTKVDVTTGESWMAIDGGYYTYATLLLWIKQELTYKYSLQDPSEYTTLLTNTFNGYLTYLQSKSATGVAPVTIPAALSTDPGDGTKEEQIQDIIDAFNALKTPVNNYGAAANGNVAYYDGGINYYKIMIKHDNIDTPDVMNELGEFGVVRNAVYDVTLRSINNPGYPVIPDPDPDTPDEEEENWISVKINVNPWTWYSQIEDI